MDKTLTSHKAARDLRRLTVRGSAATFTGHGVKFVLNLGSTMVLARLLSPQDFGLIAMVTAFTGLLMIFKDFGLSMATIQRSEISGGQLSNLFWVNVVIGLLLMAIGILFSSVVSWFYNDQRLVLITSTLSVVFLFGGLTVQHQALLRRQMRFVEIVVVDVLSVVAGILVAVCCAWFGLGYWSLVWMQLTVAAVNAVGIWVVSGWMPSLPRRGAGVRSMIAFGGYLTGFNFLNYFARNFDNILVGKYSGAQTLGEYSRAYSLLLFPMQQIVVPMTGVAVPALSRIQSEPLRYRNYYLKGVNLIAYLSFPLVITIVVFSNEIILFILGEQWIGAIPIFQILALAALFQPVVSTVGWIYVSLGRTRRMAIWGMASSVFIVCSFVVGMRWGAMGVASCYSISQVLLLYPCFVVAMKNSPLTPKDVLLVTFRPFLLGIAFGGGMFFAKLYIATTSSIISCAIAFVIGCFCAIGVTFCWPAMRRDLINVWSIVAEVFTQNNLDEEGGA